MNRLTLSKAGVLALLLITSLAGHGKTGTQVGLFEFRPSLGISRTSDDNLYAEPNNVTEERVTRYTPALSFYGRKGHNTYAFSYEGDFGFHDKEDFQDYDDHAFSMDLKFDGAYNDLDIGVVYAKLHEKLGDGASEGPLASLRSRYDQYDLKRANGIWEFGAESVAGFQLSADRSYIDYTNNLAYTQMLSREEDNYGGRLYFRASDSAKIFLEQTRKNVRYVSDSIPWSLDNKEDGYAIGFEWFVTDQFSAIVKGGELQKDFETKDPALAQYDLADWDAEVSMEVMPGSVITLVSSRYIEERRTLDTFVVVRENSLSWRHALSEALTVSVSVLRGTDVLPNILRVDEQEEAGILFEYDIGDSVVMGFGYQYQDNDSNIDLFDYDRETFYFEITIY
ncbi:MAG: outer membrane beta-barrel protein [Gammaproteobacteria bacterium]|nr:outer membrane beta-barrel protein [Gammaproteobacteria bacterium]